MRPTDCTSASTPAALPAAAACGGWLGRAQARREWSSARRVEAAAAAAAAHTRSQARAGGRPTSGPPSHPPTCAASSSAVRSCTWRRLHDRSSRAHASSSSAASRAPCKQSQGRAGGGCVGRADGWRGGVGFAPAACTLPLRVIAAAAAALQACPAQAPMHAPAPAAPLPWPQPTPFPAERCG